MTIQESPDDELISIENTVSEQSSDHFYPECEDDDKESANAPEDTNELLCHHESGSEHNYHRSGSEHQMFTELRNFYRIPDAGKPTADPLPRNEAEILSMVLPTVADPEEPTVLIESRKV